VRTGAPYVSSLLYYQGLLYMATENGTAACVDASDGKTLWKKRLGGWFSASPVGADGKVYLLNEDGEAWVLRAGREFDVIRKNDLEERVLASPVFSKARMLLRTDDYLVCIGNGE
jgi:outer membrane protein assembly factor BamB